MTPEEAFALWAKGKYPLHYLFLNLEDHRSAFEAGMKVRDESKSGGGPIPEGPLKRLGAKLASLLDDDRWADVEPLLLACLPQQPHDSFTSEIARKLLDPNLVHANMLRGIIAPITMRQCAHVHGERMVAWLDEVEAVVAMPSECLERNCSQK